MLHLSRTHHSSGNNSERGQILIMVVLLMVIVLTIGLSLAARSLTNIRQTTEEDSSQRAFSAAEAGINLALKRNTNVNNPEFSSQTSYDAKIKELQATTLTLQQGLAVKKNESVDVWLSEYSSNGTQSSYTNQWTGTLKIHFGDRATMGECPNVPAFDITIIAGTPENPVSKQYAFDRCQRNGFVRTGVDPDVGTVDGKTYKYAFNLPSIPTTERGIVMRIIPLYYDTPIAVSTTSGPLPRQGRIIESVGTSGGTQRKIIVEEGNPKLPIELFPYTLFTPSTL